MKITLIYKLNLFALSVTCFSCVFAQERLPKLSEKFVVNEDVTIHLNTSHTEIVFEGWNKNTVEVEAYIEGDNINENNKERFLQNWKIEALGNSREIKINSLTGNFWSGNISSTSNAPTQPEYNRLEPVISDMLRPILKNIENNPMPSALSENLASMNFDTNKFKENEEKYIQQWGEQIKEKFGDNYENVVKSWTNELSKNAQQIQPNSNLNSQDWAGEEFARRMQAWASQFSGDLEITQRNGSNVTVYRYSSRMNNSSGTVHRIVKVKMPKKALLKLNIRHGNVQLAEKTVNMVASLSHTSLQGDVIDGDRTFIRTSYSPIAIKQWNNGRLAVNYVKNCRIQKAKNLRVNADSSNLFIQELEDNAAISGSFGAITIANLSASFSTLDLAVENSDFKLKLPEAAFNIAYSGVQSRISLPKTMEVNARRNFGNVFVNGFNKTRDTDKAITINSKYSDIILQ